MLGMNVPIFVKILIYSAFQKVPMPQFAANLTMLFNEAPFLERFDLAGKAGFKAVEFLFPYAFGYDSVVTLP